jgi:hypothetical protein
LSPQRSDRAWAPHVITRDVEASAIADFALVPPRTALAATVNDEIVVLPVRISLEGPADAASSADDGPNGSDCAR